MKIIYILFIQIILSHSLNAEVKHFESIQQAVKTFIHALENRDEEMLSDIFTPKYKEIIRLKGLDAEDVQQFLNAYTLSNRLASYRMREVYLEVGSNTWSFPVPLVHCSKGWSFDIEVGLDNIITRTIGRNELALIELFKEEDIEYELLNAHPLSEVYSFLQDKNMIVAIPKEYALSALMSFVLSENEIFEADLKNEDYIFDDRFTRLDDF